MCPQGLQDKLLMKITLAWIYAEVVEVNAVGHIWVGLFEMWGGFAIN